MMQRIARDAPRWVVLLLLTFATGVMFAVSVRANYLYGLQLGLTEEKRQLFAWANVAADIWKAVALIVVSALWRNRQRIGALTAAAAWSICLVSGINSAVGIYVLDRFATTSTREARHLAYRTATAEIDRVDRRIGTLAPHRSRQEIEAHIASALARPVIVGQRLRGTVASLSDGCSTANLRSSNSCAEILQLRAELASAIEGERLRRSATELRESMRTLHASGAAHADDPVGEFYAWITRDVVRARDVSVGFPLFFALLIEVVSAFGPACIVAYVRASRPATAGHVRLVQAAAGSSRPQGDRGSDVEKEVGHVDAWMSKCARPSSVQRAVTLADVYSDYCRWCDETRLTRMSLTVFEQEFDRLRNLAELASKIPKHHQSYYGMELVER